MAEAKKVSLRESFIASIGSFLWEEKFDTDGIINLGILEIINLISDYHEEGNALFPEILITNSLAFFRTIPHQELIIHEADLTINEFKNAIKLCAPLASGNWIIFIEVKDGRIKYGLITAELSETSPSIYNQTVGELKVDYYQGVTIAYIRNIGQKTVELAGLKSRLIISLTLEEPKESALNVIQELCEIITSNCDEQIRANIKTFFEKIIDDALKKGHGNLIGVIEDDDESILLLNEKLKGNAGIYLSKPIDFEYLISEMESSKSNESSTILKNYSSILKSMLNHDGITIVSNKGKVIGYHILIGDFINEGEKVIGGARSKAFKSMENCGLFKFCFYKSQDGNIKMWKKQ